MQNSLSVGNLYINDFHRKNSMAAQREVRRMSLHPYSREQKIQQIMSLKGSLVSKEKCHQVEKQASKIELTSSVI
jgi:hypothetical protein|nr:hypothetical protein [uncultured Prevotella sp.]